MYYHPRLLVFFLLWGASRTVLSGGVIENGNAGAISVKVDAIVDPGGKGDFKTIQDAVMAAPYRTSPPQWVIRVKPGIYDERVYIQRERGFLKLVGDDLHKTLITGKLHAATPGPDGKPIGTFRCATVQLDGDGLEFYNLTFENSAGPVGQALALRADGDKLVFRNCRFLGWQDTVLLNRGRQYFENCRIEGHVDFIFGGATSWFENCDIHSRKGGYLTAASTPPDQEYGFIFHRCRITGTSGEPYYLGRPWRSHAMTLFADCEIDCNVRPEGWHNWGNAENERTTRYYESCSTGPGANSEARVNWVRKPTDAEAAKKTAAAILAGTDGWNPTR